MSKAEISKFDKISKLMDFFCIICTRKFSHKLGEISNLEKHLRCHEASREYIQLYRVYKENLKKDSIKIDERLANLIKFFITSTVALTHANNPYLFKAIDLNIPDEKTFRTRIIPDVVTGIKRILDKKLSDC